jgi:hypothetical protein
MVSRPSRRVRAQVSYKEPSLNTKMRRPGKELVDAVPDQDRRTSVDPQTAPLTVGRVSIKQEPDDSAWKPLGTVPGHTVEEDGEVGSPLRQKLDRSTSAQDTKADAPRLNSAAASHAITAMIEETRRKSLGANGLPSAKPAFEPPEPVGSSDSKTPAVKLGKKDDLAIFDFNESSPLNTAVEPFATTTAPATASSRSRIDLAKAARSARRHSAVPAPMTSNSANDDRGTESVSLKQDAGVPSTHKRTASGSIRNSHSSNPQTLKNAALVKERERQRERRGISANNAPSAGHASLTRGNEGDGEGLGTRAERAATRRKSMMI